MYKLAVVSGTRAEYGLLRPVLHKLAAWDELQVDLIVTGAHLSLAYGYTIKEIEADGFPIAARLDILSEKVLPGRAGTAQRTALALNIFVQWLCQAENRPDALLVLGDRYEIFAAGQAAALLDIPLIHISGGDVTLGADDDWFRHCLTKMAKLHFPSCEVYRQRLIRMGEAPRFVHNVGGLGDENIRSMPLLSREQLAAQLDFELPGPFALITMHPETATNLPVRRQGEIFCKALDMQPQLFYLFTAANADAGGDELNALFAEYCRQRLNCALVPSLGVLRYLSAMKHASLVLGNSSSGVVETPSFGTPCIDIGQRQTGRQAADNVLHCPLDAGAISQCMQEALSPEFATRARQVKSPYNGGDTSGKIVSYIRQALEQNLLAGPKVFYDCEVAT